MRHKAGQEFFRQKPEWSKYKHLVLDYYLKPYLAHVNRLKAPILLVDLFAGPGIYGDGSYGSPIILAEAASRYLNRPHGISVLAVEKDKELVSQLRHNTDRFGPLIDIRHADCIDLLDEVAQRARDATTFLYVDPFSIGRLHLGKLSQVFQRVSEGSSVELLFVFMANAFMRWAGACLRAESDAELVLEDKMVKRFRDTDDKIMMAEALWDPESVRLAKYAITSTRELDAIAGGTYWRQYVGPVTGPRHDDRVAAFVQAYCDRLRQWFQVVIPFPIHSSDALQIRKYWMIFATRYKPAIDLINRAMATARREQFQAWKSDTLFAELESPMPVPQVRLEILVMQFVQTESYIEWRQLRWKVTQSEFGAFTDSEINNCIKRLLRAGKIKGPSGSKNEDTARITRV